MNRTVAVKKLIHGLGNADLVELQAVTRIDHPNVLRVFDVDETQGIIVMEYIAGGSLESRMRDDLLWVRENFDSIFLDALEGIRAAHAASVIHRDIKPANLLIDETGRVKVADFGVARILDSDTDYTVNLAGSYPYMAPEVLDGRPYKFEADMHSIGCTMYEVWAGKLPYVAFGRTDSWILAKSMPAVPLREVAAAGTDSLLHDLVDRLLTSGPDRIRRAETAAQLLRARRARPSVGGVPTIDDLQDMMGRIYSNSNAARSELEILGKLAAVMRELANALWVREDDDAPARLFPRAFAWLCALATATNTRPSELIWLKFDGACPYCEAQVCECASNQTSSIERKEALLARMLARPLTGAEESKTFELYAAQFKQIYGEANRAVPFEGLMLRFFMEHAEAQEAVLELSGREDADAVTVLHLELSDLFAWFFAVLNAFEARTEYRFVESFKAFFEDGCYVCHRSPCECPSSTRLLSWRDA